MKHVQTRLTKVGKPLLVLCVVLLLASVALAQSGGSYKIIKWVVPGGGGNSTGGLFELGSSASQTAAGEMSGGDYDLSSGFWGGVPGTPSGFDEDFDDGQANNWNDDGSGTWSVLSGTYAMTGNRGHATRYSYYNRDYSDFTFQVDAKKHLGDSSDYLNGYGLRVRSDGNGNNYYMFLIDRDGKYVIGKRVNGDYTSLVGWTSSNALSAGYDQWNTLKVVALGSTLQFYANGTLLNTIQDASLSSGKVELAAFDAADSPDPDTVMFDNAQLTLSEVVRVFLPVVAK